MNLGIIETVAFNLVCAILRSNVKLGDKHGMPESVFPFHDFSSADDISL